MRSRRFFSGALHDYQTRDSYDYARILQSFSSLLSLKQIHARIFTAGLQQNPFIAAKLLSRYADIGSHFIADARMVFDNVLHRDAVLYNLIIRGYATSNIPGEAAAIYNEMLCSGTARPNLYTFPFVLKACAAAGEKKIGRAVHAHVIRDGAGSDLFVNNSLIAFYAKCALVNTMKMVFDGMPYTDLVTWNSIISGYAQNGFPRGALALLHRMLPDNSPDYITLVAVLPACAVLSAFPEGMWIHSYALKRGIRVDAALGSGLIEMYSNCGRLCAARKVLERITEKNVVVYNSIIKAYGMHGHATAAMDIFSEMITSGIKPDSICFVSILSACSHAGFVEEGFQIFNLMDAEYGVEKNQVHYACMVDLLGRAGRLGGASEFIKGMPVEPGRDVLGALLGACRCCKNVEIGEEAARRLLVLDPENAGRYAALVKMYEDLGRWDDVARVRKDMKIRGVRKTTGYSLVEVAAKLHRFGVEDEAHPMRNEIFEALVWLQRMVDEDDVASLDHMAFRS